jgi:hypothetical protein
VTGERSKRLAQVDELFRAGLPAAKTKRVARKTH